MILKARERGNAPQLASYLMDQRDNEHVELHEVRGFISDDLKQAFSETHAIAQGTRCENYMFSMSFNPPEGAHVSTDDFEKAIDQVEETLGLKDQPRAVIFHEKDGRRHAHVAWSRIDTDQMRSINISHYKNKLRDVSRELFLKHGWSMPRGLEDRRMRNPLAFTRAEWEQARRVGLNPKELKAVFRKAWDASDNRAAFEQALKERGFTLAQGDRRGFVAVDYRGEVYGIGRQTGIKANEVAAKLGDPKDLPTVDEAKAQIAERMTGKVREFIEQAERDARRQIAHIDFRKADMVARHREERETLTEKHEKRWQAETLARAERLPKGMSGIWHRITGRYGKIRAQNEAEALDAMRRDRLEKDELISRQLDERQKLQDQLKTQRESAQQELLQLRADIESYASGLEAETPDSSPKPEHEHDPENEPDNTPRMAPRGPRLGP